MKMLSVRVFLLLVLVSVGLGCRPAASPVVVGERPVSVNGMPMEDAPRQPFKPIPEMSWTRDDGTVQKLKDFHGRVVILDFWATYCAPCIEAIPHLMELERLHGKDDLAVVGLHVGGPEDRPKVPEFVERLNITYDLGTPEDELSRFVFGRETAIPQTAIFGRDGKFIRKIVGFNDKIKEELDRAVADAVGR
ncbi:MAG TPA: TlpA disulfide reductase family protein [Pyrinomonadaceae bacterium]|nr:TlpA disulfide reductase family protein [Pyrinomonadaceae bacterium]